VRLTQQGILRIFRRYKWQVPTEMTTSEAGLPFEHKIKYFCDQCSHDGEDVNLLSHDTVWSCRC
jgi:hypothetical protein